jgi:MFS family permease
MVSSRIALLTALGADNAGSGLFLPVALLYVTRDVGLPLAAAGTVVALGTAAGLAVPPVAAHLGDRIGPRRVMVAAQLLQALGAVTYLAARGAAGVAAAAVLLAAGQQLFYSSLFALISDVAGDGPKDRPFAVAAMVRSACFGLGGLAAAGLLSVAGSGAYRIAVAVDAASFAVCALLLALLVRTPEPPRPGAAAAGTGPARVWSDRPFVALIVITGLVALPSDFFLSGISVYLLEDLRAPPWLPGAVLALATGLISAGGTTAVRLTRRMRRTTTMALGAALYTAWSAASLAAGGDAGRHRGHGGGRAAVPVTGQRAGRGRRTGRGTRPVPGRVPVRVHRPQCPGPRGRGTVDGGGVAALAAGRRGGGAGGPGAARPGRAPARRCPEPRGRPGRGGRQSRASSITAARAGSAAST